MNDHSLEGRILAHRHILLIILRELAGTPAGDRIQSTLRERSTLRDGQEDPGAVDTPGLAIGLAVAQEFQKIAEEMSLSHLDQSTKGSV